jgi:two-component system, NtrC family, nitrogen regulation sensor histidine kinase GlnL
VPIQSLPTVLPSAVSIPTQLQAQQRALLEAQSTPVLLISAAGRIVWANPAVLMLFKSGLKQLQATCLSDWLTAEAVDAAGELVALPAALSQVMANPGQPLKLDVRLQATHVPMQAIINATENDSPHTDWPLAVELINHAPALLVQAAEHRAAQQAAQRELLRNLAHEIRNPLGGIRGAAQLLARELSRVEKAAQQPAATVQPDKRAKPDRTKQPTTALNYQEYTDVIVAEATRLQTLLDRLLSAQATPRTLSLVNVHQLLERVRSVVSAEYTEQIDWRRDYDVSLPDICLDEHQIVQVLLNLVRNAAQILLEQSMPHHAVDGKRITLATRALRQVTLGASRHKLALELLIIDNGPGIPPKLRSQLFNPLVTQRAGGTGLGLHIAQSFVQQHGGMIEVDSEIGHTAFRVVLPMV